MNQLTGSAVEGSTVGQEDRRPRWRGFPSLLVAVACVSVSLIALVIVTAMLVEGMPRHVAITGLVIVVVPAAVAPYVGLRAVPTEAANQI